METELAAACEQFRQWLSERERNARIVVFCHSDADGLSAGALFGRGLRRAGFSDVRVTVSQRGESAFSDAARTRLAALQPAALIVADLGVRADGVLPTVPTVLVDHHQPAGEPEGTTVISGYSWNPVPASAWLAYELLQCVTDMEDLAWIAAIGTIGDLGDRAPWPRLAAIRERFTSKWIKEATVLINAARRSAAHDVETPLRLLMHSTHPRQISQDAIDGPQLQRYREEVNAELRAARRHAPVFSATGPYALIRLHSPSQVHPLIAQQWRGRLPKYAVIAANSGYLPHTIAFSMRTARQDLNLPQILQGLHLGDFSGRFGYGHDQASGGQLPPDVFEQLLALLGFAGRA